MTASRAEGERIDFRAELFWMLGVCLASVAVFLPTLNYEFLNWDDTLYVANNPWLWAFDFDRVVLPFLRPINGAWTPLQMLVYLAEFQFFGLQPWGYRLVSVLMHGVTMAGAYALFRQFGAWRALAALLAVLIGVHPLRIESVVWISELKGILCQLFYIWGLVLWIAAPGAKDPRRVRWFSVACGVLALLSKPLAVSFPLAIILYDALFARPEMRRHVPFYAAVVVFAGVASVINLRTQDLGANVEFSFFERLKITLYGPLHYAITTVAPWLTSPLYPREFRPTTQALPTIAGAVFTLALIGGGVFAALRGKAAVAFGIFAAFLAYLPVSGIVSFSYFFAADRFSYLLTIFIVAALVPLLAAAAQSKGPAFSKALSGILAIAIVASAAGTVLLSRHWQDSVALFERMVARYPESSQAQEYLIIARGMTEPGEMPEVQRGEADDPGGEPHWGRGVAAMAAGRMEEALEHFRLIENDVQRLQYVLQAQERLGRFDDAATTAAEMLALDQRLSPNLRGAAALALARVGRIEAALEAADANREPTMGDAGAYALAARAALGRGDNDEAEEYARMALDEVPFQPEAMSVLALSGLRAGDRGRGEVELEFAAEHPAAGPYARVTALAWLAAIHTATNRTAIAADLYEEAFNTDQAVDWPLQRLFEVALLAERIRRPDLSEEWYRLILERDPDNQAALQNLPPMLIVQGRPEEALEMMQETLRLYPDDPFTTENLRRLRAEMAAGEE